MTYFFVILIFACLVLYEKLYERKVKKLGKSLPGPPTIPILGNAHQLTGTSSDFLNSVYSFFKKYGDRFRIFIGPKLFVVLQNPSDVEVVLSSSTLISKSDDYDFFHPWLGEGLLTSTGEKWKKHRKLITPSYHFNILINFLPIMETQSDIFIKKLFLYVGEDAFDIYTLVTMCTLDIIAESAMGTSVNAQMTSDSDYVTAVKRMSSILNGRMRNPFTRLDVLFKLTPIYKVHNRALAVLHNFTNYLVRNRKKYFEDNAVSFTSYTTTDNDCNGKKKDIAFLDLLLLSKNEDGRLSDNDIREQVDTFLFEGHDTTASAISFALYMISQNEKVQQKIYDEQKCIFVDDLLKAATYKELQQMKYLEMAIKETLRLYPSVPLIGRKTYTDTNINDMHLPANTTVIVNLFCLGRNPKVFEDPEQFRPERFQADELLKRNPYSSPSFSAGPRNCIGQKFAMMEMKMVLSKVVRRFVLRPGGHEPTLSADIILKSASGVYVRLEKRDTEV